MNPIHYARKKRQLHYLAKRLHALLTHTKEASQSQVEKLISKIKKLIGELMHVISSTDMKRLLGATAIYLGISFPYQASAQEFAAPQANPFGITPTYYWPSPVFADLDGDGDTDLLVGEYFGNVLYFENTGSPSNPQFSTPVGNPFGIEAPYYLSFPSFTDLDGDGDIDLLVGEYYGAIKYYENIGSASNPQFAAPKTNPFGLDSTYVMAVPTFADIDGDGDMDLFVGEYEYDVSAFHFFENIGSATDPKFGVPQPNPFGIASSYGTLGWPAFADLDEDGDLDLLRGSFGGIMLYFENTGSASNPQFASPLLNPFGLVGTYHFAAPAFADLDGDGDMDLLVGEYYGDMHYFENTGTSAIEALSKNFDLKVFPNPVSDILTFQSAENIVRIELFNTLGQTVSVFENHNNKVILSKLNPGTYIAKFTNSERKFTTLKIQKQ